MSESAIPHDIDGIENVIFNRQNPQHIEWLQDLRKAHSRVTESHQPIQSGASNITIRVPRHFLGRDDALATIHAALQRYEGRVAITALHGMRGVGKTVLAATYAERHRADYRATWWLPAATPETLRASLAALGTRLSWLSPDMKEEEAVATTLARLRDDGEGILLIYDNAIDAQSLAPYLPQGDAAHIIITSNSPAWGDLAEPVEIRLWLPDTGADFLIARTGRTTEHAAAIALSETLGGLPLAHEMAAAFCEQTGTTLAAYAALYAATPLDLLDDTPRAPGAYHDGTTVARAFTLAIEQATARHPAAAPLLAHAALLAPEPIPVFLFAEGRDHFGEPLATALAGLGLENALAALRAFALIDREPIPDERDPTLATDSIRLHRLVRHVAATILQADAAAHARGTLLSALVAVYPEGVFDTPAAWPRARRLDALALALLAEVDTSLPSAATTTAALLNELAAYRHGVQAAYSTARQLYERALAIREQTLGPNHPQIANSLNNLSALVQAQGDLAAARPLFERALAIREQALGPDHPNMANSLNNLAQVLQAQGDLLSARPLVERALAIRRQALGPDHPDTAISLNNLGGLLQAQGDLFAARPLFEHALAIRERVLGADHPATATSLTNLAHLLHAQGDLPAARPLYDRALAIRERVFGPDHPDTATNLNNLAGLLIAQGDLSAARQLFERALAILENALGPAHPYTLAVAGNTALLYTALNRPTEAAALRQRYNLPPPPTKES